MEPSESFPPCATPLPSRTPQEKPQEQPAATLPNAEQWRKVAFTNNFISGYNYSTLPADTSAFPPLTTPALGRAGIEEPVQTLGNTQTFTADAVNSAVSDPTLVDMVKIWCHLPASVKHSLLDLARASALPPLGGRDRACEQAIAEDLLIRQWGKDWIKKRSYLTLRQLTSVRSCAVG